MARTGNPCAARIGRSILLAAALAALLAPPAAALVIGDFEGSFDGWSPSGAVTTESSIFGVGPTLGGEFLQLRTGGSAPDAATLESFFGFSSGTLDGLSPSGNAAIEGSAVSLILAANAGDEIRFDFNFLTRESVAREVTYRDFFFSTIRSNEEGEVVREDVEAMSRLATSNPNWDQTGWQSVQYTFQTTGTFVIGFGVVDVADKHSESRLFLDNLQHIPEPSTGSLLSLGLLGLAMRRRAGRS